MEIENESQPSYESASYLLKEVEQQKREVEKKERQAKFLLYRQYIEDQRAYFLQLLNFINDHIICDLNAKGGLLTEPLRLEARIKSFDSALVNDSKARDPYAPRLPEEEEKNSNLSDVFGITFIYSGDPIDEKTLKKASKSKKPFPKPEKNENIEALILTALADVFTFYPTRSTENSHSSLFPYVKRKFGSDTLYDSLHSTICLKPNMISSVMTEESNLEPENIPMLEIHITEEAAHKRASLDTYHILKFASIQNQSDFHRAKERNDTEKMEEIMKHVKQELQTRFNQQGYQFIPETSIPEMYVSTESGEIKQLPMKGLNGIVKKLFYFLDITKRDFRDSIEVPTSNSEITFHSFDPSTKFIQERIPDEL